MKDFRWFPSITIYPPREIKHIQSTHALCFLKNIHQTLCGALDILMQILWKYDADFIKDFLFQVFPKSIIMKFHEEMVFVEEGTKCVQ